MAEVDAGAICQAETVLRVLLLTRIGILEGHRHARNDFSGIAGWKSPLARVCQRPRLQTSGVASGTYRNPDFAGNSA